MPAKPNEIRITRVYNAPVKLVWEAWTDLKHVEKWWGPRGFTLTTHSKELRTGGYWRYTMHGPDGKDWPNYTRYLEIDPLRKMVYDHGASDENAPPLFRVTVTFADKGGRTEMVMTMALATAEAAEQTRQFIKQAGGNSTWDRLAEYLDEQGGGGRRRRAFFINRTFKAPIARVFEAWSNPEHLVKWLAPKGMDMTMRGEIAVGKTTYFTMMNEQVQMHGRATYREIAPPVASGDGTAQARLVYEQQFVDEQGNVARHPMTPVWPETMLTIVTLAEEGLDETRVTIEWEPVQATEEEVAAFVEERTGMTVGWTSSLDKMEELLGA